MALPAQSLPGLSLAAGVCLAESLAALGVRGIGLKWPNDLVTLRGKLGGILIELGGCEDGVWPVVIGVGVNVDLPVEATRRVGQPATDLRHELGARPARNPCAARLLDALAECLVEYQRCGLDAFRQRWSRLDVLAGRPVRVQNGEAIVEGVARGIDVTGALRVETAAGILKLDAGDVSVRAVT